MSRLIALPAALEIGRHSQGKKLAPLGPRAGSSRAKKRRLPLGARRRAGSRPNRRRRRPNIHFNFHSRYSVSQSVGRTAGRASRWRADNQTDRQLHFSRASARELQAHKRLCQSVLFLGPTILSLLLICRRRTLGGRPLRAKCAWPQLISIGPHQAKPNRPLPRVLPTGNIANSDGATSLLMCASTAHQPPGCGSRGATPEPATRSPARPSLVSPPLGQPDGQPSAER